MDAAGGDASPRPTPSLQTSQKAVPNLTISVHRHQWGDVPPPTYGSTAVRVSDRWLLLFGGKLHSGGAVNSTHLLDLTTFEWRMLNPRERYEHSCAFLPLTENTGHMIVFGGCDISKKSCVPVLYALLIDFTHPETCEWTFLQTEGTAPPPRRGAAAVIVTRKNAIFLFIVGGLINDPQTGEITDGATYFLTFRSPQLPLWTSPGIEIRPPRAYHTVTAIDDSLLVFGGCAFAAHYGLVPHHDLQVLSLALEKPEWRKVRVGGTPPSPRFQHAACLCDDSLVVSGGRSATECFDDFYRMPLSRNPSWTRIASVPSLARSRHAAVQISKATVMFFGGADLPRANWRTYNDMQVVTLESVAPANQPSSFRLASDVFDLDAKQEHKLVGRASLVESLSSAQALRAAELLGSAATMHRRELALAVLQQLTSWWSHSPYLTSGRRCLLVPPSERVMYAQTLLSLCAEATELFKQEASLLRLQQPVVVFGDLHGNYEDLVYLGQRMWPCGVKNTPGQFLFLGDYVDRGPNSPEVVAFLLAHKLLYGKRWFLVRGNHETRLCNQGRGQQGFLGQCVELFGEEGGMSVWETFNKCFDMMPVAALINGSILCCHGGIPRMPLSPDVRLDRLQHLPKGDPAGLPHTDALLINDLMWSDPVLPADESVLNDRGFAPNNYRGQGCVFGSKALDDMKSRFGVTHLLRAHQAKSVGITLAKQARVLTIFSTSADHGLQNAHCGCVLVSDDEIRPLIGRPDAASSSQAARTSPLKPH